MKENKKNKEKDKKEQKKKEKRTVEKPTGDGKTELDKSSSTALISNIFKALEQEPEEEADVSAWADLELSSEILSALSKMGFSKPTLIQSAAIPEALAGHDVVGKASTGSGKTLAFGIPILEKWIELYGDLDEEQQKAIRPPTALIISPTRELAHQLTEHITNLCKGLSYPPYVTAVTGGLSVQKQQRQLGKSDIIIGTPGRLWEVMGSSTSVSDSIKQINFLVVDEADRLLMEGHFKELEEIINALDRVQGIEEENDNNEDTLPTRQTLVFSATFHKGLQQKLAGKARDKFGGSTDGAATMEYLLQKLNFREEKPKFVDVNPISQMAERLKEGLVECGGTEKV